MNPERFFIVGGVILIAVGVLQLLVRPRRPGEVGLQRYLNRGTVWTAFVLAFGVAAILMGAGVIPGGVR